MELFKEVYIPRSQRGMCKRIIELDFNGYAIGGVSVGESDNLKLKSVVDTIKFMPNHKPRYLMGVGEFHQMIYSI